MLLFIVDVIVLFDVTCCVLVDQSRRFGGTCFLQNILRDGDKQVGRYAVMLRTCAREVRGLNLGRDIGFLD